MATLNRSANDSVFRPGKPLAVSVHVVPDAVVKAYAVEETPPVGWVITNVNNSGNFVGGILKFGVYFDNAPRDFSYVATPPLTQVSTGTFSGVVSFDGASQTITGLSSVKLDKIAPLPPQ